MKFKFNKSGQALAILKGKDIESTTVSTKTGLYLPSRARVTKKRKKGLTRGLFRFEFYFTWLALKIIF